MPLAEILVDAQGFMATLTKAMQDGEPWAMSPVLGANIILISPDKDGNLLLSILFPEAPQDEDTASR